MIREAYMPEVSSKFVFLISFDTTRFTRRVVKISKIHYSELNLQQLGTFRDRLNAFKVKRFKKNFISAM